MLEADKRFANTLQFAVFRQPPIGHQAEALADRHHKMVTRAAKRGARINHRDHCAAAPQRSNIYCLGRDRGREQASPVPASRPG